MLPPRMGHRRSDGRIRSALAAPRCTERRALLPRQQPTSPRGRESPAATEALASPAVAASPSPAEAGSGRSRLASHHAGPEGPPRAGDWRGAASEPNPKVRPTACSLARGHRTSRRARAVHASVVDGVRPAGACSLRRSAGFPSRGAFVAAAEKLSLTSPPVSAARPRRDRAASTGGSIGDRLP